MDRLAFEAACEHSALVEELHQQTRQAQAHILVADYQRDGQEYAVDEDGDDDDSYDTLDVRRTPPFQSRAVLVPLSMPMTRRSINDNNNRQRERDRGPLDAEAAEQAAQAPPSVSYEPTTSASRAEMLCELGEPNGPNHCFACRYARNQHVAPIALEGIEKMRAIIRSSAAGANKVALARELADYFEEQVRQPSERYRHTDEEPVPEWAAIDIYEHFFTTRHARVDAISSTERRLMYLEQAQEAIFDEEMWAMRTTADGRQTRVPKAHELAMVLKLNDAINKMYAIDPQKLKLASQDAPNISNQTSVAGRNTRLMGTGASFRI